MTKHEKTDLLAFLLTALPIMVVMTWLFSTRC